MTGQALVMKGGKTMRHGAGGLLTVLALLAFAAPQALACSCACGDPRRAFDGADVIFDGRPAPFAAGHVSRSGTVHDHFREIRFMVTHVWRSDQPERGAAIRAGEGVLIRTHPDEGMCGVTFQDQTETFVLARRRPDGTLWTNLCMQVCAPRDTYVDQHAARRPDRR